MPPIDPERNVGYTERDEDRAQQRLLAFLLDRADARAVCVDRRAGVARMRRGGRPASDASGGSPAGVCMAARVQR